MVKMAFKISAYCNGHQYQKVKMCIKTNICYRCQVTAAVSHSKLAINLILMMAYLLTAQGCEHTHKSFLFKCI